MAILKSKAKFTEPFVGKKEVIVMLSVQDGQATASATELNYDAVHALEQTIVDLTFASDTPQTEERPAGCSKDWSTSCTSCERYFSCDYLSGRQTGTGSPIGDYRDGVGAWQTDEFKNTDCPWK